ncbi:MAG: hypothetical protein ACOC9Z_08940 [Chloroflexota bacterium]
MNNGKLPLEWEPVTITLDEHEIIRPGDTVTFRRPIGSGDYKAKTTDDGGISIKYRSYGRKWREAVYGPDEMDKLHKTWRRVRLSPAMRFLVTLKANMRSGVGKNTKSWLFKEGLQAAIRAQMEFWEDDFLLLCSWDHRKTHPNVARRLPYMSVTSESWYSFICKQSNKRGNKVNLSAAKAWEKARNRTPFIWNGERLHEGARFPWEGAMVKLTSFRRDDDGREYLVACKQRVEKREDGYGHETITEKIYRITHEDLAAAQKDSS